MNDYVWYFIFNLDDFLNANLVSRTYTLELQNIGEKEILVTKGNIVSITVDGIMLSYELALDEGGLFAFDGYAVFKNQNENVFLGIPINED